MAHTTLPVQSREGRRKGAARKLRTGGRIPAVLYGRGKPSRALSIDPALLERLLRQSEAGMNTLFDLALEGDGSHGERVVLVKELQRDPVDGRLLHADLYEVDLARSVEVEVPVHVVGEPRGVKLSGGILDHSLRELRVECLPGSIPDSISVEVSELDLGDSLHVRDLAVPEGVTVLEDLDRAVLSIVAPAKEVAPAEAEAALPEAVPVEGEEAAPEAAAEAEEESKE